MSIFRAFNEISVLYGKALLHQSDLLVSFRSGNYIWQELVVLYRTSRTNGMSCNRALLFYISYCLSWPALGMGQSQQKAPDRYAITFITIIGSWRMHLTTWTQKHPWNYRKFKNVSISEQTIKQFDCFTQILPSFDKYYRITTLSYYYFYLL